MVRTKLKPMQSENNSRLHNMGMGLLMIFALLFLVVWSRLHNGTHVLARPNSCSFKGGDEPLRPHSLALMQQILHIFRRECFRDSTMHQSANLCIFHQISGERHVPIHAVRFIKRHVGIPLDRVFPRKGQAMRFCGRHKEWGEAHLFFTKSQVSTI